MRQGRQWEYRASRFDYTGCCRRDSLSFPAQPLSHCTLVIPVSLFEYKEIILSGVGYGIDTELHSHAYAKLLDST